MLCALAGAQLRVSQCNPLDYVYSALSIHLRPLDKYASHVLFIQQALIVPAVGSLLQGLA